YRLCRDHDPTYNSKQEYTFDGLVGKQVKFVLEYCGVANANATEAADRAGYGGDRGTLQSIGSTLLKKPKVKAAILARFDELSAPGEEILKRMTEDARLSVTELLHFDKDGLASVRITKEQAERYGTLIKEIECDPETGHIVKLKLNDSQKARTDLAKIRRLFTDAPTFNFLLQLHDLSDEQVADRLSVATLRMRGPRSAPVRHGGNGK
ncbi:hypothetical protein LCGC14_2178060, partial [marine sediment metagenome]